MTPDEVGLLASEMDVGRDQAALACGAQRRRADLRRRPRRQQRGGCGRDRPPRHADQRGGRRLVVPRAVRAAPPAARIVGRQGHRLAQPARDLRGPQASRDARPADRLGLPQRRHPGPALRGLDDAAGRPGDAGGQDRIADPADRHPAASPVAASRSRWAPPIDVPPNSPAELQRATQAMADALAATIATAPEQWYSFKPIWPASVAEAEDLERRAGVMLAGRSDPGPGRGLPRDEADAARGGCARVTLRTRALIGASWLACHLPEGPADQAGRSGRRGLVSPPPRREPPRLGGTCGRVCEALAAAGEGSAAARAAALDPRALERLVRAAFRHQARYYLEVARTPALRAGDLDARLLIETPETVDAGLRRAAGGDLRGPPLRRDRAPGAVPRGAGRWRRRADGNRRRRRPPGLVRPDPWRGRRPDRRAARGSPRAPRGAQGRHVGRARRGSRPDRAAACR